MVNVINIFSTAELMPIRQFSFSKKFDRFYRCSQYVENKKIK